MTPKETVQIVRFIRALCPQQRIDEYTPDAWHEVIGHLEFDAARAAVIAVKHSRAFIDPSDIIAEIRRAKTIRPRERTVRQALEESALRGITSGAAPPNAGYAAVRDQIGERVFPASPKHPALTVACPWCNAGPGRKCFNIGTGRTTSPHAARADAAKRAP